jgi:hypothetical protein
VPRSEHSWGRRRVFILWGVALTVLGLVVFSNAKQIGLWFGDETEDHPIAIGLAIGGLMVR